jgi:hypothetical protein
MTLFMLRRAIYLGAMLGLCGSTPAMAQSMNFSYYSDVVVSADSQTIWAIVDGYDNSTGCSHSNYANTGTVYTPAGSFQDYFAGLSMDYGVPTGGAGNYSFYNDASVTCSCFGTGLGAGGGSAYGTSVLYRHHYTRTSVGNPSTYTLDSSSQNRRCSRSTMTWPSAPSPEPTLMNDEGFYWSLFGNPVACLSQCTATHNLPVVGPSGPTLGPATCG